MRGKIARHDASELRKFQRFLRIAGRVQREHHSPERTGRRLMAAARLVYGKDSQKWPKLKR